MRTHTWIGKFCRFGLSCLFATSVTYASTDTDILYLTDRGSVSDTPYVVPNKKWLIEGGYQYLSLKVGGPSYNIAQAEIVRGIDFNTELFILLPTYNALKNPTLSGFDMISFGTKHEIAQGKNWLVSLQGIVTLPGYSNAFGPHSTGGQLNALAVYAINDQFGLASMLGFSSVSEPNLIGGGRFYSCNPSLALTYQPIEKMSFFAELFGKTQTDTFGGSIVAADCGFLYKIAENTSLDFEFAQNLSHDEFNYRRFLGAGVTTVF